jgi:hypothetical protein
MARALRSDASLRPIRLLFWPLSRLFESFDMLRSLSYREITRVSSLSRSRLATLARRCGAAAESVSRQHLTRHISHSVARYQIPPGGAGQPFANIFGQPAKPGESKAFIVLANLESAWFITLPSLFVPDSAQAAWSRSYGIGEGGKVGSYNWTRRRD